MVRAPELRNAPFSTVKHEYIELREIIAEMLLEAAYGQRPTLTP